MLRTFHIRKSHRGMPPLKLSQSKADANRSKQMQEGSEYLHSGRPSEEKGLQWSLAINAQGRREDRLSQWHVVKSIVVDIRL